MLGLVDGSGLIDVFSLGWGTPSHKGTLTAYENSVEAMFVMSAKDYPEASTAIRAYFKKQGSSIAQACKAIGFECERYDDTLGDFFAHKYAVHAGVECICPQKSPVDSPRDMQLHMRVSLPKRNFWRQPDVVPVWMDEKQPSAFVATHIGWRSLLWKGFERCHKTHEERVDFILKVGRDTVKFMAALQKYVPQGVFLYVSLFQVGAGQFTVPYVMIRDKTRFFGRPEKKTSEDE